MNITSAQYVDNDSTGTNDIIKAVIDGETRHVPLSPANTTYAEIMRQVEAGELVIQEAEA